MFLALYCTNGIADSLIHLLTTNSYTFPIIAYGFIGIEIIALTAYEARDVANLRWPARIIPIFVVVIYFMCTIGEALNVMWSDPNGPVIYNGTYASVTASSSGDPPSTSVVIRAIWYAGRGGDPAKYHRIAGIINGCLIFSALSAANTSLYVASRTLFGMTQELRVGGSQNWLTRRLKVLAKTHHHVPVPAILFTLVSTIWVPFLTLANPPFPMAGVIEFISVSGSVAVVMVWGSICVAYIRYKNW